MRRIVVLMKPESTYFHGARGAYFHGAELVYSV